MSKGILALIEYFSINVKESMVLYQARDHYRNGTDGWVRVIPACPGNTSGIWLKAVEKLKLKLKSSGEQ